MKKLFLFTGIIFFLTSFVQKDGLAGVKSAGERNSFCGSAFTITNPITAGNGGYGCFGIQSFTLDYGGGTSYTTSLMLYTGDPDQSYGPFPGSNCTVSVDIYVDWDQLPNYVGIKDNITGQTIQCFLLIYGRHTYTFNNFLLGCTSYTIFTTDQPC